MSIDITKNDNYIGLSSTAKTLVDTAVAAIRAAFADEPEKKDNMSALFNEVSAEQETA